MSSGGRGKVILFGEHAVVYGHPALAAALALGVTVTVEDARRSRVRVPAWGLDAEGDHPVVAALGRIQSALGAAGPVSITGVATVPARAGLGSSAALSVAIARALAADAPMIDDDAIERAAQEGVKVFHQNPSGVDVALATRGGIGIYRRGVGLERVSASPFRLCIGLSGEARDTAARVAHVAALRAGSAEVDARLRTLGELALAGRDALGTPRLGALFDEAHAHLSSLGLGSPGLDRLIALARGAGALGAKLTGAGGGGAVIALPPDDDEDRLLRAWRGAGFEALAVEVGSLGS